MSKKLYRVSAVVVAVCMIVAACYSLLACNPAGKSEVEILTVRDIVLDTTNAKTEFAYGEEFSAEGLKVTAILSDDSEREIPLEKCRLSKVRNTPGKRKVSVTYAKKTKRYEVVFADKPMPPISEEIKLEIAGAKTDGAYRVQAEDIDLAISGVAAAGGELVVADETADGGKYVANYGNTNNYFGFTFDSDAAYENVTLNVRMANPSTENVMQPGSNIMMYLNYAGTNDSGSLGITRSVAVPAATDGGLIWSDFVVRGLNIKEGANTLTFGVLDGVVPCIDYFDFYVGKYFSTASLDVAAAGQSTVMQIEDMGLEKITTRDDYLAAYDLEQGEICVLPNASANDGKGVFALQQGEVSTLINAETDSTVQLILSAACNVGADWSFAKDAEITLDGQTLKINEFNIRDQSVENTYLWKDSSLGFFDLEAGEHILDIKINNPHASFDALTVKTVTSGSFAETKPEVYIDGTGTFTMEGEHLDPSGVTVRKDYAELVVGQQYGAYNVTTKYASASGRRAIDGFTGFPEADKNPYGEKVDKTVFTFDFYLAEKATVDINAVAASQLGVNFRHRTQVVVRIDNAVCSPVACNLAQHWNDDKKEFNDPMWVDTKIAHRNLEAGNHTFTFEVVQYYFILDCFKFNVTSYGEFAPDVVIDGTGEFYAEAESLDPTGTVARADFLTLGTILSERDEYAVISDGNPHGGSAISGLAGGVFDQNEDKDKSQKGLGGTRLTANFELKDDAAIRIYIGAKADIGVAVWKNYLHGAGDAPHVCFYVDGDLQSPRGTEGAMTKEWKPYEISEFIRLEKGMHTFTVEMRLYSFDLDYIRFDVIGYGENSNGKINDITLDGKSTQTFEAEWLDDCDVVLANGHEATLGYKFHVGTGEVIGATNSSKKVASSNNKYVFGLGKGTKIRLNFDLKQAAAYKILICAKSNIGVCLWKNRTWAVEAGDINKKELEFFIDGELLNTPRRSDTQPDLHSNDTCWVVGQLTDSVSLDAGSHTLLLDMIMYPFDIDYIQFVPLTNA